MAVEERGRKLQSGYSVVKMFQIDDHIGAVALDTSQTPESRLTTQG